ncbi:MAG: TIGR02556 family CRISPR-associated protein [Alkaliphilus sp.]
MIEIIRNIGKEVRYLKGEEQLVDLWLKDEKAFDYILTINLKRNLEDVNAFPRAFEKKIFKNSLFYQQGNAFVGAAIKIEKIKLDGKDRTESIRKLGDKVSKVFKFIEINNDVLEELVVKLIVEEAEEAVGKSFIVEIKDEGRVALETHVDKFNSFVENTCLSKQKKGSQCHICGANEVLFNTVLYNCFTNDKEVYTNTEGLSYAICRECLMDMLHARKYVNQYLKAFWIGSEVMFLPHAFNEDVASIFEDVVIDESDTSKKFIERISRNEAEVLYGIGKGDSTTDIIFFKDPKSSSEWKIEYQIRSVMPSRFTEISILLKKYSYFVSGHPFSLWTIVNYLCDDNNKSKESKRLLDVIFTKRKYSTNILYRKLMTQYKKRYFEGKKNMTDIHRVINFMYDCGCIENGWKMYEEEGGSWTMVSYRTIDEVFEKNTDYFDSNEKKAWFVLGRLYDNMIYQSKNYKKGDGEKASEMESHLEKSFFFGRKYDYKTFIYFVNKCNDLMVKYGVRGKTYLKKMSTDAQYLMKDKEHNVSNDEAKYVFFWGMNQFIGEKKEEE